MDTTDEAGQPQVRFFELVMTHQIDLQIIADLSGVPRSVVDVLFIGETPVPRIYAEKVCELLSIMLEPFSLDTVHMCTVPTTFVDLFIIHKFSLRFLGARAGVITGTVAAMIDGLPVPKMAAERVLATLSKETGQDYRLENVEVKLQPDIWAEYESILNQSRAE